MGRVLSTISYYLHGFLVIYSIFLTIYSSSRRKQLDLHMFSHVFHTFVIDRQNDFFVFSFVFKGKLKIDFNFYWFSSEMQKIVIPIDFP